MQPLSEDYLVMVNLENIRSMRPWIDCEFVLYQKLCQVREEMCELQLINIRKAKRETGRKTTQQVV